MPALYDRVRDLVIEQLKLQEPDKVTRDADLIEDLGADSLDIVDLTIAVEEAFADDGEIEISDEDAEKIRSIGDIVDFLEAAGLT